MERLTENGFNYDADFVASNLQSWPITQALKKLQAYEDSGLELGDIKTLQQREDGLTMLLCQISCNCAVTYTRLRKLAEADRDGKCVVLPCKVGDMVWTNFAMSGWYFRDKDKPYSAKVVFVGLNESKEMGGGFINVVYGKHDLMMQFRFSDIGKTVFLSRADAEVALGNEQSQ